MTSPDEWAAIEDFKHRIRALRASIDRYVHLQRKALDSIVASPPGVAGYTPAQQQLNSEADAEIEALLNKANQLRRALRSPHLPAALSGQSFGALDAPIKHVRNIREHWDDNRPFWSNGLPIPTRGHASARWFMARYPDKTPWSSSWSNADGSVVCGIIRLNELLAILSQLEASIPASQ